MSNSNSSKQILLSVIGIAILVIAVVGVAFAFFNYTRTGASNTIKTGRIAFNTSQSGTFSLTNVFPIERSAATLDEDNSDEVIITISGETTYTRGIEYLVTLEDVNIKTNDNKKIPVGLIVTPENTGELGDSDNLYFTNRGGNTSIFKSFVGESDFIEEGQYLLVGYIRPGVAEVNGTIGIRAFIDKDSIAITDTKEENISWQEGRMVISTSEWNSLNQNGISFKVRVQANEGIWVGEPTSRNDMKKLLYVLTTEQKSNITEINFIRMSEEMINTHTNLIDLTFSPNGQGVVKGWIEGTKLYVASPGITYLPEDSSNFFSGLTSLERINFGNADTSNVTNMSYMFYGCSNLISIDLSELNTANVTYADNMFNGCTNLINANLANFGSSNMSSAKDLFKNCVNLEEVNISNYRGNSMYAFFRGCTTDSLVVIGNNLNDVESMEYMFQNCTSLATLDISKLDTSNVTNMSYMFYGCTNLATLDISKLDTSNVTNMSYMFSGCTNLVTFDISKLDTGNVTNMSYMFYECKSLTAINLSSWNTNNIETMSNMFTGCTNLEEVNLNGLGSDNLENVDYMFGNLKTLNMRNFNFGKCSSIRFTSSIENIDLSNSIMLGITNDVNLMFISDYDLKSVNLSNVNLSNATSVYNFFNQRGKLKEVVLTNLDISGATDLSGMFSSCNSLEEIDLSTVKINYNALTKIDHMFAYNSKLKTIYVSNDWDVSNVSSSDEMFYSSLSIVGGNGTTYDNSKVDKAMAIIDGTNNQEGYLTNIADKPKN